MENKINPSEDNKIFKIEEDGTIIRADNAGSNMEFNSKGNNKNVIIGILSLFLFVAILVIFFIAKAYIKTDSLYRDQLYTAYRQQSTLDSIAETMPIQLTAANFDSKVFNSDKPCIVDFYASWCPPCQQLAPILEVLAKEYKGKIYIYEVNTDAERELSSKFNITAIPTTFYVLPYAGNTVQLSDQGYHGYDDLVKKINTYLLK